ncbi:hypothetical protein B0A50_07072 [Salinomyces thailandicus]|uniref:Uncharacterized protein n=1 Tax=Salinomyces thailandicus TaxID=706561 RepID=A0A4U0TP41_9PEZI|nr:hypothetical protein B0A50_07072 [Salinomyces thailandica]
MSAATAFPTLPVPVQEDNMEMSSPQNRGVDDDYEIDFDLPDDDGDEHMLTDSEQTRPPTATDENMDFDDAQGEITRVMDQETDMQDTPGTQQQSAQQEDEELIDYDDDDYFDQPHHQEVQDTAVQDVTDSIDYGVEQPDDSNVHVEGYVQQRQASPETVDEEIVRQPEDVRIEQPIKFTTFEAGVKTAPETLAGENATTSTRPSVEEAATFQEKTLHVAEDAPQEVGDSGEQTAHAAESPAYDVSDDGEQTVSAVEDPAHDVGNDNEQTAYAAEDPVYDVGNDGEETAYSAEDPAYVVGDDGEETAHAAEGPAYDVRDDGEQALAVDSEKSGSYGEDFPAQAPLALETSTDIKYAEQNEGPSTPTDTGLHPVMLYYGEHSMPLFKSKTQQDGLLKDDNLANLSLAELMRNCRQRLAFKIGIAVPEEQELVLAFDPFELPLAEYSRAAYQHSLNDVLDVFLQLHQNDGTTDIPALSLSLHFQQFTSHLSVLQQAVADGKGMSSFVSHEQLDSEEYYDEVEEDGNGQDGNGRDGGEKYDENQAGQQQYDDGQEDLHEYYEGGEEAQEGQEYYAQDAQYEDGQEYEEEGDQATDAGQPSLVDPGTAEVQKSDNAPEEAVVPAEKTSEDAQATVATEANAPSPARSQTVQDCTANGEYDDLIDYGDDDLTDPTSEQAFDDEEEFLSLIGEGGAGDAVANPQPSKADGAGKPKEATKPSTIDDDIDFDDDTTAEYEARQASRAKVGAPIVGCDSPLGKRSREEQTAWDDIIFDDEMPEAKKPRSE